MIRNTVQANLNCLLNHYTAVHEQRLAMHPRALVARQEVDQVGNVLGLTQAVEGAGALEHVDDALGLAAEEEVGGRGAGGDGVDADAAGAEALGQHTGHLLDGALGGGVEEVVGRDAGEVADARGDEDDAGAAGHVRHGFLFYNG